jgi:hypothetical protein
MLNLGKPFLYRETTAIVTVQRVIAEAVGQCLDSRVFEGEIVSSEYGHIITTLSAGTLRKVRKARCRWKVNERKKK